MNIFRSMRKVPFGIMLEVPSVMFIIDQCCEERSISSVSAAMTLTLKYLLAVDRDNNGSRHYNSLNPAFCARWTTPCRRYRRKWIGLCGELGGERLWCCRAGGAWAG